MKTHLKMAIQNLKGEKTYCRAEMPEILGPFAAFPTTKAIRILCFRFIIEYSSLRAFGP
jgi:hypothetical protein